MTLPRVNTGTYDTMAVREQYRTHLSLTQKSHPLLVPVSGLAHAPGGFLFPEWVALFTGIRILAYYRMRYPHSTTDPSIAEPFFPQPNNVSDLAHADPLVGHGFSYPAAAAGTRSLLDERR